jgi:hypothetical protein
MTQRKQHVVGASLQKVGISLEITRQNPRQVSEFFNSTVSPAFLFIIVSADIPNPKKPKTP